jgi:3-hydroxyisobutyrate dehydrogenase-like beta-hydroxyacid dehydrogenase
MARATKSPMPVTETVATLFRLLLAQGHAPGGFASIMQLYPSTAPPKGETT